MVETKFLYTSQNQVINGKGIYLTGKENGIIPSTHKDIFILGAGYSHYFINHYKTPE